MNTMRLILVTEEGLFLYAPRQIDCKMSKSSFHVGFWLDSLLVKSWSEILKIEMTSLSHENLLNRLQVSGMCRENEGRNNRGEEESGRHKSERDGSHTIGSQSKVQS